MCRLLLAKICLQLPRWWTWGQLLHWTETPPRQGKILKGLDQTMPWPTTTHHHTPRAKIYPPLSITSQKMDHPTAETKLYSYITSFWHCLNYGLEKHMVRKHYYNFRYLTNMLKIRSRGFDRAQYCNVNQI